MDGRFASQHSLLASIVVTVAASQAALPDEYVITDQGTLGGSTSAAFALNDLGQVSGSADMPDGYRHAFLWTEGQMIDLGTLPGFSQSEALGMNNLGQVVGIAGCCGYFRGFHWDDGVMIDVGDLVDSGDPSTLAYAVNDLGQVVGYTDLIVEGLVAFVWEDGVITAIPSQIETVAKLPGRRPPRGRRGPWETRQQAERTPILPQ